MLIKALIECAQSSNSMIIDESVHMHSPNICALTYLPLLDIYLIRSIDINLN